MAEQDRSPVKEAPRHQQLSQEERMEALGALVDGLAHDLNNLLAVFVGNLEHIAYELENGAVEEKVLAESLAEMQRATHRGEKLVERLDRFALQANSIRPSQRLLKPK